MTATFSVTATGPGVLSYQWRFNGTPIPGATSSILTPVESINAAGENIDVITKGRHDPCVGIRAVPVGEAMMACVLADHLLRFKSYKA